MYNPFKTMSKTNYFSDTVANHIPYKNLYALQITHAAHERCFSLRAVCNHTIEMKHIY